MLWVHAANKAAVARGRHNRRVQTQTCRVCTFLCEGFHLHRYPRH